MGKRTVILMVGLVLLLGCAGSAKKMNNLQVGMTRADVIEALGPPDSTSANLYVEYLKYGACAEGLFSTPYYVRLQDGIVTAYGRYGDFGLGY
ncbi:MAG: hypothetical protein WAK95_19465 [Desulfobacterales bacterium]